MNFIKLIITIILLVSTSVSFADTLLGVFSAQVSASGKRNIPRDSDGNSIPGTVFRNDADGGIYIKFTGGMVQKTFHKGSKILYIDPDTREEEEAKTTGQIKQEIEDFLKTLDSLLDSLIDALTAISPTPETEIYALGLSDTIVSAGNEAKIFGDSDALINGMFGFSQESGISSIIGSSTADGFTPVLFEYTPSINEFDFVLNDSPNDPVLTLIFGVGETYSPIEVGNEFIITGRVPEPDSILLMLIGIFWLSSYKVFKTSKS
jgi:hypothetical protein